MRWYSDGENDLWFFGGCKGRDKFSDYQKERRILRTIIDTCYKKEYDPFIMMDCFCISDMAQLISDGYASGYFYGESKFLHEMEDLSVLRYYKNDWDIVAFHWLIDVYLTARFDLGMSYLETAKKFPVKDVYRSFSPLHETSEINALAKMQFTESDLLGCIINAKFYLYRSEIPTDKLYLLKLENKAAFRKGLIFMSTVFFHKPDEPNGYLSNFYPSKFELKGKNFSCMEQYMMWSKAKVFGDTETAEQVLKESNPDVIKGLGRQVKGYKDSYWASVRYGVVKEGLLAKFSQNENLKDKLLSTSGRFAECAKNDSIWGIGLAMNDPKRIDQLQWNGQNLLGFALGDVYSELK